MKDINEKQIEEMTNEVKKFKERTRFLFGWDGRSKDEIFATLLLEAGYRKQSDTVWEFVERISEVAQRALENIVKQYWCDNRGCNECEEKQGCIEGICSRYIQQAEREIEEEKIKWKKQN